MSFATRRSQCSVLLVLSFLLFFFSLASLSPRLWSVWFWGHRRAPCSPRVFFCFFSCFSLSFVTFLTFLLCFHVVLPRLLLLWSVRWGRGCAVAPSGVPPVALLQEPAQLFSCDVICGMVDKYCAHTR